LLSCAGAREANPSAKAMATTDERKAEPRGAPVTDPDTKGIQENMRVPFSVTAIFYKVGDGSGLRFPNPRRFTQGAGRNRQGFRASRPARPEVSPPRPPQTDEFRIC